MKLKVITTGSKGNAYILSQDERQLLLDAGASKQAIMQALGFTSSGLQAALCTHEHGDHSKAIPDLLAAGIPVYTSQGTAKAILGESMAYYIKPVTKLESFDVESWKIMPFDIVHDAAEPFGFVLHHRQQGNTILYLTDTSYSPYKFAGLTDIIIECNHNEDLLAARWHQKEISADMYLRLKKSHFSLERLIRFLGQLDLSRCKQIVLVHLSDSNSDERLMVEQITAEFKIPTVAAKDGLEVDLSMCPF
jgi:phosphoribosyl 1,2-cyclic phosphodiesterase